MYSAYWWCVPPYDPPACFSYLFLLKAVVFLLVFLSSSISTYRIFQSQSYWACQTWVQRRWSEAHEQMSRICSMVVAECWKRFVSCDFCDLFLLLLNFHHVTFFWFITKPRICVSPFTRSSAFPNLPPVGPQTFKPSRE